MGQTSVVTEADFREALGSDLGSNMERAVKLLSNFGPKLSFDVLNVMLHALDQGKEFEVLDVLDRHFEECLQFQHPDVRGMIEKMGTNPTQQMFSQICRDVLKLTPNVAHS